MNDIYSLYGAKRPKDRGAGDFWKKRTFGKKRSVKCLAFLRKIWYDFLMTKEAKTTSGFDCVLFDLDGTLCDTFEGITRGVEYALQKFGISVADRRELTYFIGPPLDESFEKGVGLSDEDVMRAVKYYREYYERVGLYQNTVYEGIAETLSLLRARGKRLAVATSKPEIFARRILERDGIQELFDYIGGATLDFSRLKKADVIAYTMAEAGMTDCTRTLMVGDRRQDVVGAKAMGMPCAGVLYGFGTREELETAGADFLLASPRELIEIV